MKIYCPNCSGVSELKFIPLEGQNIICPYCNKKFSYSIKMSLPQSGNRRDMGKNSFSFDKNTQSTSSSRIELPRINKTINNLIECPDCGNKVSIRAKSCPNCGAPIADESRMDSKGKVKESNAGHNHWFVKIMNVPKYWLDAYKRIFDFSSSSDRMHLLSFIGVQFIINCVLDFLVGEFIVTSPWIIKPIIILGTYAMFSLGLRRLNDIGISKMWACVLGLIFVVGYVCDVINSRVLSSPLFSSVYRIDTYLYVLLLCISWVKGRNRYIENSCHIHLLPMIGLLMYAVISFAADARLKQVANEFKQRVIKNLPYKNMTCNVYSSGAGMSTYIINTDGPANAQILVNYVMGRLCTVYLIKCDNQNAADRAIELIKKNFELEGEFLKNFR